jgi:hypothetical protein
MKGRAVARHILIEEFHLTVYAPRGLPAQEYDAMRQTLDDSLCHARLRRTFHRVVRRHPALSKAQVRLAR